MNNSFFAILASIVAIVSYLPYLRDIKNGKTKPHTFSWISWTLMGGIFFIAQISDKAGIGALTTGISTILSIYIVIRSFKISDISIKPVDWFCLIVNIFAIVGWLLTSDASVAVLLITIADLGALIPTVRKAFIRPHTETTSTFLLSGVKNTLAIFSLPRITFISAFYLFYKLSTNLLLVGVIEIRKKILSKAE